MYVKSLHLKLLPWALLAPLFLSVLFCVYFFSDFPIYTGTEKSWLNTAQIINGILTPILTLSSIILLGLTWLTTKKELNFQLLKQQKRDELELVIRQSKILNDKMIEQTQIMNIISPEPIFEFLEKLYLFNHPRLSSYYKAIELPNELKLNSKEFFSEFIYTHLQNTKESRYNLIIEGTRISVLTGLSFDLTKYLEIALSDETVSMKRAFFGVFSILYMRDLMKHQEVKSFNYLLKKIRDCNHKYRDEIKIEFKLLFNEEIAERLIQFNDEIPNDFLKV